jgi:ERF superfamily
MGPTPKVYAAISKVMAEIGRTGITKDRKNTQQGYQFRGIDDVYNALSGLLSAAGLSILPRVTSRTVTERETKSGGVLFYVVLSMEFDLCCAEDGSKHTIAVSGEAMDSADKATNKAMSAAFKYACMQVFCIPTEGNPDADAETHDVAPKARGVDPRGDLGLNVPASKVQDTVKHMLKLMSEDIIGDHEDHKRAMIILDYHEKVLNPDEDLYVAVGDALPAAKKNSWKALVNLGKKLEKDDRATDPTVRKF